MGVKSSELQHLPHPFPSPVRLFPIENSQVGINLNPKDVS